jgi:hypothetical protein
MFMEVNRKHYKIQANITYVVVWNIGIWINVL